MYLQKGVLDNHLEQLRYDDQHVLESHSWQHCAALQGYGVGLDDEVFAKFPEHAQAVSAAIGHESVAAVSYTHLTLPTN